MTYKFTSSTQQSATVLTTQAKGLVLSTPRGKNKVTLLHVKECQMLEILSSSSGEVIQAEITSSLWQEAQMLHWTSQANSSIWWLSCLTENILAWVRTLPLKGADVQLLPYFENLSQHPCSESDALPKKKKTTCNQSKETFHTPDASIGCSMSLYQDDNTFQKDLSLSVAHLL